MKVIDLNEIQKSDIFILWKLEYKYQIKEEDIIFYKKSIKSLNLKENNIENLINIFETILKKQNLFVTITKNDVVWLLNYFNSKLL